MPCCTVYYTEHYKLSTLYHICVQSNFVHAKCGFIIKAQIAKIFTLEVSYFSTEEEDEGLASQTNKNHAFQMSAMIHSIKKKIQNGNSN